MKVNSSGCTRAVPAHPKGGKMNIFLLLLKKTFSSIVSLSPFNPMVGLLHLLHLIFPLSHLLQAIHFGEIVFWEIIFKPGLG